MPEEHVAFGGSVADKHFARYVGESAEELSRRGVIGLLPPDVEDERARRVGGQDALRVAFWGAHRGQHWRDVELDAGLRVETGSGVAGSRVRLAPRVLLRHRRAGRPLSIFAGWGRAYQYTQSVARTDVLRSGLRVSEVMMQADSVTPALRSDVASIGAELWHGSAWLAGVTGWWRESDGLLLQVDAPGPLNRHGITADGQASAYGVELSLRRVEGSVRGFANYSLSRALQHTGRLTFAAPQDRRHVANLGVTAALTTAWRSA